jgi:hypothetical protein
VYSKLERPRESSPYGAGAAVEWSIPPPHTPEKKPTVPGWRDDGRIVTAGEHFECFGGGGSRASPSSSWRGTPGRRLGSDLRPGRLSHGVDGSAYAIALQPDGRIVAVGAAGRGEKFAIARYGEDGILDTTFGGDGSVFVNFSPRDDVAHGVAIDAAGRISAAERFAIARIIGS